MTMQTKAVICLMVILALALIAPGGATVTQNLSNAGGYTTIVFTTNLAAGAGQDTTYWNALAANVSSVEYLAVAGGGGAGSVRGAGGGAGGFKNGTHSVSGIITINIGAGGSGRSSASGANGGNGANSSFDTQIAIGGGGGQGFTQGNSGGNATTGGSGGGAMPSSGGFGLGTAGQGNNGGARGLNSGNYPAGGGGGAGTVGGSATGSPTTAGNGGDGLLSWITGSPVTYAGGGGGGAYGCGVAGSGGSGGGGNGKCAAANGDSGTNGLGGGGGGGGFDGSNGGNGGSGVVIIRYLNSTGVSLSASFTQNVTNGFPPTVVEFTDTSTGSPTVWNWSVYPTGAWPAPSNHTTQNLTRLFNSGGNWTVNLTIGKPGSTDSSAIGYVLIKNYTSGDFSANVTSGMWPLAVGFTATTFNATSWNWSFGDGNVSAVQNPSHLYNGIGSYDVKLRINNTDHSTWINKTAYITTYSSLYSITANFTPMLTTGHRPTTVSFTDTSTYFDSSPATWNWSMGDGFIDTNQSPTHTFNLAGNFPINFTASNTTLGISSTKLGWVNVTNASGFNQQDLYLSPSYSLLLHIKDASTGTAIPVSIITASTGVTNTTSIGDATFWFPYSVAVVYVSSDGYRATSTSYLMDRDREETISLTESSTIGQNANTLWSPFAVAIQVIDGNMNPIIGVPVRLTAYDSSLPGGLSGAVGYFRDTYGVNNATAAAMLSSSTTYNGTTDDYGFISTQVVSVIRYRIVTQDTNGVEVERLLWPHGSYYQINTGNATTPGLAMLAENRNTMFTQYNASFWEPNSSYGCMGVRAYDSEGSMAHVYAWWKLVDNGTIWWTNTTVAGGYGPVNSTKCVPIVPYQQWKWGGITD